VLWTCEKCGREVRMRETEFPIHCDCGNTESYTDAFARLSGGRVTWINCPHRTAEVSRIPGDAIDCSRRDIRLYRCEVFSEPVTKTAIGGTERVIVAAWNGASSGYTGRACRECSVPTRGH
jgi:hypothetical protein